MPELDPQAQRAFAVQVVERLRSAGFEALWAGGCVRDQLLGRTPKDYDVATNARPEQVRDLFGRRNTIAIGAAFGVIGVLGRPRSAGQIEVATFREDAMYSDGRRPDAVTFSTAEADAERRDFTINGLFYDPIASQVIDYVGGQEDLERRVVRAIGDPAARFAEDKLRMLRAVRFAATFHFALDAPTQAAIQRMAGEITVVSAERIAAEMRLMLVHASRSQAVRLLAECYLLAALLPEIASDERWEVALDEIVRLAEPGFPLALATLVHRDVDPDGAAAIGRRWKLSNKETDRLVWLIEHQDALRDAAGQPWPTVQRLLIADGSADLLAMHVATNVANPADLKFCREKLALPPAELNPPPLITGDDLRALGIPPGREYQRLLETVRDAQLEGKVASKDDALALANRLTPGV